MKKISVREQDKCEKLWNICRQPTVTQAELYGGGVGAIENKVRQIRWGPTAARYNSVSNSASSKKLLHISRSDGSEQAHHRWEDHLREGPEGPNCCW